MRVEFNTEDKKLDIGRVIDWFEQDGMLSAKDLEKCRQYANASINKLKHPLKILTGCVWRRRESTFNHRSKTVA